MTMLPGSPAELAKTLLADLLPAVQGLQWEQDEPAEVLMPMLNIKHRDTFHKYRRLCGFQETRTIGTTPLYRPSQVIDAWAAYHKSHK